MLYGKVLTVVSITGSCPQDRGVPSQVLDSLVAVVQRAHPTLIAFRSRVRNAEAVIPVAARVQPAELSLDVEEVPNGGRLWGANQIQVAVEGEILAGGRRSARRGLATVEAATERARLRAGEAVVAATAKTRILELLAATATSHRLVAEDSLLAAAEETITARFGAGAATYVEVLRVRAERLRVRTDRAVAMSEAAGARLELTGWLAADTAATRLAAELIAKLVTLAPAAFDASSLPTEPSIASVLADGAVAAIVSSLRDQGAAITRLARAESKPTVVAGVGMQQFQDIKDRRVVGATVGATLSLPFTARDQTRASIRASQFAADAVGANGRALISALNGELNVLAARYGAERAKAQVYEGALLADLRGEREAALAAYRNGALSLFELLDFERTLLRAETDQINSVRNALITLYRLEAGVPAILAAELGLGGER